VDGMKFCTPHFRNACSHTIVVGAFLEFGEGALPLVKEACTKAPGGKGAYAMCFHGLGHGILAYSGYNMEKTVSLCQKFGTEKHRFAEYTECVGGSIMEIISGGGHDRTLWEEQRKVYLRADKPLEPCSLDIIPEKAKPLCYLYLSPHLFQSAGADLAKPQPEHFEKAFQYCDQIPEEQKTNRDACFGGMGKEFIVLVRERDIRNMDDMNDEQLKKVIEWCGLAKSQDGVRSCEMSALRSLYWGGENGIAVPTRFCEVMPEGENQENCFSTLRSTVNFYKKV
jgi:hypothetical protein